MTTTTRSAQETQRIAASLAQELRGGEFISLIGELGAGKTTFTQGLVAALGSTARVKSPTFTVMNEYPVEKHPSITRVVHCDLYRFTEVSEIGALELDEYRRPNTVIIAEWPNILTDVDWKPDITVILRHSSDEDSRERTIEIEGMA
jgi:tRNA threonylcarbamoyladenosine biosynthesis protein TsaE